MFIVLLLQVLNAQKILDSPLDQVVWCNKEIFILSSKGLLYKNYLSEMGKLNQNITFRDMLQSQADPQVIYFVGDYDESFVTQNCGRTYTMFKHDKTLHNFRLNWLESYSLLAFKDFKCNGTQLCKPKYQKQLYISNDFGQTWRMVLNRTRDATWDKLIEWPQIPDSRIVASCINDQGQYQVVYSDDYFKSNITLRKDSYNFYQTREYLFLLVDADIYSKGYDLMVVKQGENNPVELVLPIEDKQKYTFTVLDTIRGSIFISILHNEDMPKMMNIYLSDQSGTQYTLSLLNNVRSVDTGNCDFEPILRGTYVANAYDNVEVEKFKLRRTSKNNDGIARLENYKQTRITFEQGGDWHSLKAPKYDFRGQQINCNGDCSLHLLGRSEAPRNKIINHQYLVVGTGNTGIYLGNQYNTYLSRDGGHTWFEILQGMHIYDIAENTGVIVFVNDEQQSNEILYTWDEGLTFSKLKMNITMDITNVVYKNKQFVFYGVQDSKTLGVNDDIKQNALKGLVYTLNLDTIIVRECVGFDNPGDQESDYEYWYPTNYAGDKCLFGIKEKFIRRKRTAQCYNSQSNLPIETESCPCTKADWECDVGYRRDAYSNCIPMNQKQQQQQCKGTYLKSQGYRKLTGDECQDGVYLGPIETKCEEEDQITKSDNINIKTGSIKQPQDNQQQQQQQQQQQNNQEISKVTVKETKKNGFVRFLLLIFGIILLMSAFYVKKKYVDAGRKPQKRNPQYYPQRQQENQRLFADI